MTTRKEQWEALIIEYSHWTRVRNIDPIHGENKVILDEEDLKSIDNDILSSFEGLGGFDIHPDSLDRYNHPLARFYYLFYTERGNKDIDRVFSSASSGIPAYADGVGALFIDQVIRYMIFVDYSYFDAYRFGQLICSVAVFRNTFDDNTKKFIEKGLLGSRKRLFKVTNTVVDNRAFIGRMIDQPTPVKYIPLDSYGIQADYPEDVANDIISNYRSDDPLVVKEFLNVEEYGRFNMDGISLTTPLKVNKSVYSMIRKFVLHVMHLLVNLVESPPSSLDIVYDGTADPSCFNALREVIPKNYNFVQGIDKINSDNYTIVILDDENDKEPGSAMGDDSKLIYQNSIVRGIFNGFKTGSKLLGISMNLRIPNVIDGSGMFTFCPGDIYLTPWKNPSDDRMRLVWSPKFLSTNVVNYDVKMLDSARKYQDYVVRNLYNFREEYLNEIYTPIGLIDGEFDSELERFIVSRYYEKFPEGLQLWNAVADMDTNIIVPPRFIGDKTFESSVKDLQRYFDFIIKYHTDIPSNPMLVHASRCARGGMFCVGDLLKSPLTESVELIFGKDQDQAMQTFELYERISDEMDNVIRMIEEKRLFRGFRKDLTLLFDLIKELTKNYKEILKREPIVHYGDNYEYQVFGDLRSNSIVMIIQLGDTFGTIMNDLNERLSSRNITIGNIVYEGTFSLEDPAKAIFREFIPPMTRVKNVYDIKPIIEKASVPFIVIRGVGYPNEIYDSFINSWSKSELFRGSLEVSESLDVITKLPVKKVSRTEKFNNLISTILVSKINDGIKQGYRSCLFIGSDMEDSLDYISGIGCSRVFHLVDSGFGGKKVVDMTRLSKRISHRVFVNENMYESFVLPVDMTFEIIICHPVAFSRFMKSRTVFSTFMKEVVKGFGKETVFSTVDLSGLVDYCNRNSSQDYSYGRYFTNNYFTMTIGNETFTLNGKQGFITEELSKYKDVIKHSGLYYSYIQTGNLQTYDRYEDNEDDEEDGYDNGSSLSIVRDMLYGINIHKVKVEETPEAYQAYEANVIDVGKGVREYNNLVKRDIINSVDKRTRILDLACGHGQDISKWFGDESVEMYIGMDGSQKEIAEAESRLRSRRGFKPKNTRFLVRDLFGNQGWTFDAQEFLRSTDRYNVVSCQLAIHYAFIDERTIKRFMYNVSNLLEIGGEFIVTTLDDSVIKTLVDTESNALNSLDKITIEGEYYKITIPQQSLLKIKGSEIVTPGVSYDFTQFPSDPMSRTSTEYIVDSRYFKSLAADMGMELISSENFTNIEPLREDASKMDREELKVIAFYRTYRFRKIADAKFGMTIYETPLFKYTDSKIQLDKTLEIINKNIAENTLNMEKFDTGLFMNPEIMFPAPYINQTYKKINVLVEDVNMVRTVAKQMQLRGRITDKENILVNRLPTDLLYDFLYTPYNLSNHRDIEKVISKLSKNGVVYGTYVDLDRIDSLTTPTGSEFSNYIFGINVDRQKMLFSINNPIDVESYDIFDKSKMKEVLDRYNMELTLADLQISDFESLNHNQKQYVGLFGMYRISKKTEVVEMEAPQVPVNVEDELTGMMEALTTDEPVDKFVLLPGLVQKKAPGKGRDETLSSTTSARLYKDLGADSRWRFKLSDDWESREFVIRMPSGEEFESVTRALIYYKCEFSEEANQEYRGLNLASGLPQPVDIKPFTKAVRGKKGVEWKQREQTVLKKIYEAKFTNTPNVVNDDPENLSPLQALLLTRNAQLYSNSKTRNELLESVRNTLKNIVNV